MGTVLTERSLLSPGGHENHLITTGYILAGGMAGLAAEQARVPAIQTMRSPVQRQFCPEGPLTMPKNDFRLLLLYSSDRSIRKMRPETPHDQTWIDTRIPQR
jgi:hypothetical protein